MKMNRLGGKVVEMKKVYKSFGEKTILKGFDYIFKKGERGWLWPEKMVQANLPSLISSRGFSNLTVERSILVITNHLW